MSEDWQSAMTERLKGFGFVKVDLDTRGYRRGSLNEGIKEKKLAKS